MGTPFVSMRGGVGGGVFITDAAVATAVVVAAVTVVAVDAAAVAFAADADAVGCVCFDGVFFAAWPAPPPPLLAVLDFVVLVSVGFDLVGSLSTFVAGTVVLFLSIFRFFFFGLSSMADSDVLASFAGFDCFFFPFDLISASCSIFFYKLNVFFFRD